MARQDGTNILMATTSLPACHTLWKQPGVLYNCATSARRAPAQLLQPSLLASAVLLPLFTIIGGHISPTRACC